MSVFKLFFQRIYKSSNERSLQIKQNILYGFIIKGVSILVNLLYVPLLINYLDKERYGIWIALSSFLTWFHFFDIGLGNGLRNRLTEALAKNDTNLARKLVSTSYTVISIIFLSIGFLFIIISRYIPWNKILNTQIVSHHELVMLATIVFVFMCLRFIVQLIQPILFALQKSALASIFPVLANVLSLITLYLIMHIELPKLLSVAFFISITPIVSFLIGSFILFKGTCKNLTPSLRFIDFTYTKSLMSLGLNFFLIQIASVIINSTSNLIIIQLFGPNDVTSYNVGFKYFQIALMLNAILIAPFWSSFTDAFAKNDYNWAKSILRKMNYISIFQVLGVLLMLAFSQIAIKLWIGDKVQLSWLMLIALAINTLEYIVIAPYGSLINGAGKLKASVFMVYIFAVLFLILAILLGKSYLGVAGIVFASCIIKLLSLVFAVFQTKLILTKSTYGIWAR